MTGAANELATRLWPGRVARVEALPGGITNANFMVDLGDELVVVRLAGENTDLLGIDRDHEAEANELAHSIGVAPALLQRSPSEGWMVTRFLVARPIPPEELAREPMLGELATTLRSVHRAGTIGAKFNPFRIVRGYHQIARTYGVEEPFDYPAAISVLDVIEAARPFAPRCFCHNDLLNANFLYDERIRILDWEYAGMGDPFFDLANFSVNHELAPDADEALLEGYFGVCDDAALALLALMKTVSELRESMWGVVQMAVSSLEVDFTAYAKERSARFETLVAALDLEATARAAEGFAS